MFSELPIDILLEIIRHLPPKTIASLSSLSKAWASFIDANESSIYHNASKRYEFAPKGGFGAPPPGGWKAWLIRKLQIELRWIGKLPGNPYRVTVPGTTGDFHRIKVDEEAGYTINTFTTGGLVVSDIHDHRILWSLDQAFCGRLAHCEHDEGYIVFNRIGNYKEVWRRRVDILDILDGAWPSWLHNKPDSNMIRANLVAQERYLDPSRSRDPNHLRGHFVPWARLLVPEDAQAFKLTRGTLLVSGSLKAFLYDVESAELKRTIDISAPGQLRYVDVSERHVFIISTLQLNVYLRANGSHILSLDGGKQPRDFYASPANQYETCNRGQGELGFQRVTDQTQADREDSFHAAHVSSCGKHLAVMTMSSRIILIPNFWRLFSTLSPSSPSTSPSSPITLQDISMQVDFHDQSPSVMQGYLAYDRGKVAIACVHGVFVLVLDSILGQLGDIDPPPNHIPLSGSQPTSSGLQPPWPNLRLREIRFDDPEMFDTGFMSCLQLTETKLYLSYSNDYWDDERGDNMWCYDFASSPPSTPSISPVAEEDWGTEEDWGF